MLVSFDLAQGSHLDPPALPTLPISPSPCYTPAHSTSSGLMPPSVSLARKSSLAAFPQHLDLQNGLPLRSSTSPHPPQASALGFLNCPQRGISARHAGSAVQQACVGALAVERTPASGCSPFSTTVCRKSYDEPHKGPLYPPVSL